MPGSIQNTAPFLGASSLPIGGPLSNYVRGPNTFTATQSSLGGPSSGSTVNPNLFLGQSHNSFASVNGADSLFPLHGGQGASNQSSLVAPPSGSEINSNLFHGERPVGSQNSFTSVNATNSLSSLCIGKYIQTSRKHECFRHSISWSNWLAFSSRHCSTCWQSFWLMIHLSTMYRHTHSYHSFQIHASLW